MAWILGIDIGGTSIKAGLFTPEGQLQAITTIKTTALVSDVAYAQVVTGLKALLAENGGAAEDVIALGLDIPGPVDADGNVGVLPNISLDADGLLEALKAAFSSASIAFINDANAAALGEAWQGGAKGMANCVMVTLGTGVGGGVICNGELVAGAFGAGGEIGHITMNLEETAVCGCGRTGCLEQYASAKGIVRMYLASCKAAGQEPAPVEHETDTLTVFKALAEGDQCAQMAVDQMCEYLGRALAQISCVVDPEIAIIGGGVAGGFKVFAEALRTSFRRHCHPASAGMRIEAALLGNEAGMYGSAYCALQAAQRED